MEMCCVDIERCMKSSQIRTKYGTREQPVPGQESSHYLYVTLAECLIDTTTYNVTCNSDGDASRLISELTSLPNEQSIASMPPSIDSNVAQLPAEAFAE